MSAAGKCSGSFLSSLMFWAENGHGRGKSVFQDWDQHPLGGISCSDIPPVGALGGRVHAGNPEIWPQFVLGLPWCTQFFLASHHLYTTFTPPHTTFTPPHTTFTPPLHLLYDTFTPAHTTFTPPLHQLTPPLHHLYTTLTPPHTTSTPPHTTFSTTFTPPHCHFGQVVEGASRRGLLRGLGSSPHFL